jgi:hypothetical protein
MSGSYCKIFSSERPWSSAEKFEGGNMGHRPPVKGGYFPVPPVDSLQDIRSAMCLALEQMGVEVEVHHHEVAAAGQNEIGTKFETLVKRADWLQILKYAVHNTAHAYGKTATFMPKPIVGDNGSGMHCPPVGVEGRQESVRGRRLRGPLRLRAVLHRRRDQAREGAERDHESGTNSYKRLVPGFEAPINLAYSARNRSAAIRIPYVANPKGRRLEVRFPDPTANPYLAFSAMLMAGLDGVQNKIHPGDPMDKNLYDLEPRRPRRCRIRARRSTRRSISSTRIASSLTKGGVFTERHARRVHRPQDGRGHALPHDDASGRVRDVLQPVTVSPRDSRQDRDAGGAGRKARPFFASPARIQYTPCMPVRRSPRHSSAGLKLRASLFDGARARLRPGGGRHARGESEGGWLRQQADVAWRRAVPLRNAVRRVLVFQRSRQQRVVFFAGIIVRVGIAAASDAGRVPARRSRNAEGTRWRAPQSAGGRAIAEEKLLADSRTAYADGAPAPLPEERTDAEKYRARIARLKQSVSVHEKNVEALKKELAAVK